MPILTNLKRPAQVIKLGKGKMKTNVYEQITAKVIEQLENGIVPWQRPWINGSYAGCISHTSGKPYSTLNQMLLGWRSGEWLTWGQIQTEGGRVKNGEKASFVVFWTFIERYELEQVKDEQGNVTGTRKVVTGHYPVLKSYNVFHIGQCEGIEPKFTNTPIRYEHTSIEEADRIAREYVEREGIELNIEDTNNACYSPFFDRVQVPQMEQYQNIEEYYSTLFHELTHSTGHAKRLAREEVTGLVVFGDKDYSREELVAELGAAFMCSTLGIDSDKAFKNSAAYIGGWLKRLANDKKMIVSAAAKAERAVEFILTGNK